MGMRLRVYWILMIQVNGLLCQSLRRESGVVVGYLEFSTGEGWDKRNCELEAGPHCSILNKQRINTLCSV